MLDGKGMYTYSLAKNTFGIRARLKSCNPSAKGVLYSILYKPVTPSIPNPTQVATRTNGRRSLGFNRSTPVAQYGVTADSTRQRFTLAGCGKTEVSEAKCFPRAIRHGY